MAMASPDKFTEEQLNYFRICHVTARLVPDGLRQVFKKEWDARYKTSHGEWNDTAKNGIDFYSLIPATEQTSKAKELSIIRNGNTMEWDCTCLFYAILYSKCIGKNKLDPKVKKAVDDLRQYRNKFAHFHEDTSTDADFQASMQDVIDAFHELKLDTSPIQDIKSQRSFQTKELQKTQELLDKQKRRNQEPQTFCDLPPKPSHEVIPRSSEVDTIMKEMKTLQSRHPNEVTHVYLSGNPGCGKSETARQIGEKFFDETESASSKTFVATLNASSLESLLRSYIGFARQLRVDEEYIQNIVSSKTHPQPEDKIWQLIGLVNPKLAFFSSWLMIIDNVVSLKKTSKFFPHFGEKTTSKTQVLVTTQDGPSIPLASPKIYHKTLSEGMKPDDGVNALCSISQLFQDKDVVFEIAKALDYQPLALACTAVYMKFVRNKNWSHCLAKIKEGKREQTEKPYLDTCSQVYSQSMTTAVKMALDRLVIENEVMMFACQMLSMLAQDPIPIKYVVQYVLMCMPDEDENLLESHIERASLFLISDDGQDVRVHQIVHNVLQDTVKNTVDYLRVANIITSFEQLVIKDDEEPDYDFIMSTKPLIPHFVTLQKSISSNLQFFLTLRKTQALLVAKCLSCIFAKLCFVNGQLKEARSYLEMSINIKEAFCIGKEHLLERNLLSEILCKLRDYKRARLCLEQALGRNHDIPDDMNKNCGLYLRALTNLGMTLSFQELSQDKQEAQQCVKEALEIINKLTLDIPFAGRILNNIAVVYYSLGNYAEAKEFMEQSLTIDKTKYGDNHPFVFERYNDLAIMLKILGEYKTAEDYLKKAISGGKCLYEENSPYLSTYYGNLGKVLIDLRQNKEAKKCMERALAIYELTYDDNHPTLATYLNNLGSVLQDLRQYDEAKKCMERALAIDERVYDENHPTLATDLNNLGLVLQDLRQYEEAKKCMERALAIDERVYDENHPTLATHLNNLGLVLQDLRQYEEAKKCMERALAIDERVYDENHLTLATHLNNLGLVLQDLRQYKEAKKCMERALAIIELIYDENHPTLATQLNNLGLVLQDMRQYKKAKKCMERALVIGEHVYDDNHPTLATTLSNLGSLLKDLRQYDEAKKCMERAVAIDERIYDDNHPILAIHLNNLGLLLEDLRQYEEAKKCMERAVAIDERIYDDNHPSYTPFTKRA